MADREQNPFKRAIRVDPEALRKPIVVPRVSENIHQRAEKAREAEEARTVAELNLVPKATLEKNPKVASLTVRDLKDLSNQLLGVETRNRNIADITIEDMQDLEEVFMDYKLEVLKNLGSSTVGDLAAVDVSCCCCTPCCCCAAAETAPVRA